MQVHKGKAKATEDPKNWTIDNVVDWLTSNKFDENNQDIYDKFSSACRQLILLYADHIRL